MSGGLLCANHRLMTTITLDWKYMGHRKVICVGVTGWRLINTSQSVNMLTRLVGLSFH